MNTIENIFTKASKNNDYKVVFIKDKEEKLSIFKLVHDIYVSNGYINPNPLGIRYRDHYEGSGTLKTIAVKNKDDKILGTIGMIKITENILMFHPYRDELKDLIKTKIVFEITNFVINQKEKNIFILLELLRGLISNFDRFKIDNLFMEISEKHKKFFKNIMRCEEYGGKKIINEVTKDEVIGMMADGKKISSGELYKDRPYMVDFFSKKSVIIE